MIDASNFLAQVRRAAASADVFSSIEANDREVRCAAKSSAADAWYSIAREGNVWMVRLATPDRWLSESIEADLMHYGDPIEELIEEELVELGHDPARDGAMPQVKHFRNDARMYTFENALALPSSTEEAAAVAARWLLGYEAAFRRLGDMEASDDEAEAEAE